MRMTEEEEEGFIMLHSVPTEQGKYHKSETTFGGPLTSRDIWESSVINY
jgi:hypothetical protein